MSKAQQIQKSLVNFAQVSGEDVVIPNIYWQRFELDLMVVKQSGYVYEYEIKTSAADFRKDFDKSRRRWDKPPVFKHDEIQAGRRFCNRFYFVIPETLYGKVEIPEYVGLVVAEPGQKIWLFSVKKKAPLLHRQKFDDWRRLALVLSYRQQQLRAKLFSFRFDREFTGKHLNYGDN